MDSISVKSIKIGELHRKDFGDIPALAQSISEVGLLHPIGITQDRQLVFGRRRLEACKQLGWETIPAKYIDVVHMLQAEHDENELHKPFTFSERIAIGKAMEVELAKRHGGIRRGDQVRHLPHLIDDGRTVDLVAAKVGISSGRTYERAKAAIENGAPELVAALDAGLVSVNMAATLAKLPEDVQSAVDFDDKKSIERASQKVYDAERTPRTRQHESKPVEEIKKCDLYADGNQMSAYRLAHKAINYIVQISALDANACKALDDIQAVLDKHIKAVNAVKAGV